MLQKYGCLTKVAHHDENIEKILYILYLANKRFVNMLPFLFNYSS